MSRKYRVPLPSAFFVVPIPGLIPASCLSQSAATWTDLKNPAPDGSKPFGNRQNNTLSESCMNLGLPMVFWITPNVVCETMLFTVGTPLLTL